MCLKSFFNEAYGAGSRFFDFLRRHRLVMLMLALWLLFVYGQRLFFYPMSIDSEIALQYQKGMIDSWIAIDRFGSGLTKALFGFTRFVPYGSVFMMLIALFSFCMLFCFCIEEWGGAAKP